MVLKNNNPLSKSYPIIICGNCGHLSNDHKNGVCNSQNIVSDNCSCKEFHGIRIEDSKALSEEWRKAKNIHDNFMESLKDSNGIYVIKDFQKAVLLYGKEEFLWKKLIY